MAQSKPSYKFTSETFNPHAVNQSVMADILGISRKSLTNWIKDGCPSLSTDLFDAPEVIKWRILQERKKAEIERLKAQRLKISIEKESFQNSKIKGDIVLRSEMDKILISRASEMKQLLEQMKKYAARAVGLDLQQMIMLFDSISIALMSAWTGESPENG